MVGQRLGPYEIQELIGQGGMATVYRAYQPSLNRSVALKVLSGALAADPSVRQRFQQEIRIAAALEHPNIVPIYDVGDQDGVPYIAMRLIPGLTLAELLRQHARLPVGRAVHLVRQMARGLEFAHSHHVIHRDVKPSNVLVDDEDNAYLSDFGVAHLAGATRVTRVGSSVGTPHYMAPEQIRGEEVDGRADVYSLGAVLYELVCGRPPFVRDNEMALMHAHMYEPVPPVTTPEARHLEPILQKALAKSKAARYPSARAFGDTLAAVTPTNPAVAIALPRQPTSTLVPFGLAAAAAVVVAAVVFMSARAPIASIVDAEPIPAVSEPVAEPTLVAATDISTAEGRELSTTAALPASEPTSPPAPSLEELVLAAVDRANAAWAESKWTLDPDSCRTALAGRELQDCITELRRLASQRQARKPILTALEITAIEGETETKVFVHTKESWYNEIYDATSRRFVRREPVTSYVETYTVERIGDAWIVTFIDLTRTT